MNQHNAAIALFEGHFEAENAVMRLQRGGFDMNKLSLAGLDHHSEEHVTGYYCGGDRMRYFGELGAFWGGVWGLLFGSAIFFVPGVGCVLMAGPIIGPIVSNAESGLLAGGIGVLCSGLQSLGIPPKSSVKYENALRSGKFVLIIHGTREDAAKAAQIFSAGAPVEIDILFTESIEAEPVVG